MRFETLPTDIQLKRLKTLAAVMDTVPKTAFNILMWTTTDSDAKFRALSKPVQNQTALHACGTAACAGGYACAIPAFKKAGLRLNSKTGMMPQYRDFAEGYESLATFFGIHDMWLTPPEKLAYAPELVVEECDPSVVVRHVHAAQFLFSNLNVNCPRHAAKRIRYLVKECQRERKLQQRMQEKENGRRS